MDVYRQASDIIRIVREGHGTAKALCLRREMQKKKQTYAVVCETLRHYELLEDVLENAEFFKFYPNTNHEFALCMCYDVVLGKGVNTQNDTTARAISESSAFLREAYWKVYKHHHISPRSTEKFDENESPDAGSASSPSSSSTKATSAVSSSFPRYARVNTLKISKDTLIERLHRAAENRKQQPAAGAAAGEPGKGHLRKGFKVLPEFTVDPVVPDLLVFPPGTDLHAHPAVRSGQLILQDRASCLPACVLLDAVPVTRAFEATPDEKPFEYVVDACAAPGNKTTQMAALGAARGVKIMAIERNENRSALLERRVQTLGAAEHVNVVNMDFFQLSSDDRNATEAILLDPSCSASGVVTRVDVALMRDKQSLSSARTPKAAEAGEYDDGEEALDGAATGMAVAGNEGVNPADQGNEFSRNTDRVAKLAHLQRKLLAHALLSFDNCRTVVYSTCSVHEMENEDVVRLVLDDERVQARGWTLSHIMPLHGAARAGDKRKRSEAGAEGWATRGLQKESDTHPIHYTIRCDPTVDRTNGFYVARFDRPLGKEEEGKEEKGTEEEDKEEEEE